MRPPQTGGASKQLDSSRQLESLCLPAFDLDGKHPAETAHLGRSGLVAGMAGQSGIVNGFNHLLPVEKLCHPLRVFRLRSHPVRKGLDAAQSEPAFKWRRYCSPTLLDGADFLIQGVAFPEDQRTSQN